MWLSNIDTENNAQKILTEKDIISKGKKGIYAGCVLSVWLMRKGEKGRLAFPSTTEIEGQLQCSGLHSRPWD